MWICDSTTWPMGWKVFHVFMYALLKSRVIHFVNYKMEQKIDTLKTSEVRI